MVKGKLQREQEEELNELKAFFRDKSEQYIAARMAVLEYRQKLADKIREIFLDPYFEFAGSRDVIRVRESYKKDSQDRERDYREFGNSNSDPGDIFRFFVRVKTEVLNGFIENEVLASARYLYIREYFPKITVQNYVKDKKFLQKAEDLFVFNHSLMVTQALYVWEASSEKLNKFMQENDEYHELFAILPKSEPLSEKNLEITGKRYLRLLRDFAQQYPRTNHKTYYYPRVKKIAAVMSCGKNFAVWKTAGREIPWETPPSPNNIIHGRLATGSVVDQMNAHPFSKLHTAVTHNGETPK
jgi:hypothetical protein